MSDIDRQTLRIFAAGALLFVVFVLTQVSDAPTMLRGDVLWGVAAIALVVLLAGPVVLGRRDRWPAFFFVYGCLGGLLFVPLFVPSPRQAYALAMERGLPSQAEDLSFAAACILGVIGTGLTCRLLAIAMFAHGDHPARRTPCETSGHGQDHDGPVASTERGEATDSISTKAGDCRG